MAYIAKKHIWFLILLIVIIVAGLAVFQFIREPEKELILPLELEQKIIQPAPTQKIKPEELIISERGERFSVGGGREFPMFTKELVIDPFEVKQEEKQLFSIWVKDSEGIESVLAIAKTAKEPKTIELVLVEGTIKQGRWKGFWITENISQIPLLKITFRAVNKNNQETILEISSPVLRNATLK